MALPKEGKEPGGHLPIPSPEPQRSAQKLGGVAKGHFSEGFKNKHEKFQCLAPNMRS